MLNLYLPKETTETWSIRKPEESNPDKYSRPEQLLGILEKIAEQKTVLLEAGHGEGKSTTMVALAKIMDINVIPYGTLSPKDISPAWKNIKKSTEKLDTWIHNLEKHEENPDTKEGIILMDSADYLYTRYPFIKSYSTLKETPKGLITLEELELLQYYEKTIQLMETLAKAKKIKVIGTIHKDDPQDIIDPELYKEFRKLFPQGSEYQLQSINKDKVL